MARCLLVSFGAALWAAVLATEPSVSKRYRLEELAVGPELAQTPLPRDVGGKEVELGVRKTGPGSFSFSMKVVNNIRFDAASSFNSTLAPFFGLQVSDVMSTRMMGPLELMQVERTLEKKLWSVDKWMAADQTLRMQGPAVQLEFREVPDGPASTGKAGSPQQPESVFCTDSPKQLCRMMCQQPSCAEDQCAMRNGPCCDITCVARTSG